MAKYEHDDKASWPVGPGWSGPSDPKRIAALEKARKVQEKCTLRKGGNNNE